jgi:hypothetical protein
LWRSKELRIGLAPDRIFVSGSKTIELAANDGGWAAAVESLPGVLAGKKGEASIVLADQFVRYALLPYNETPNGTSRSPRLRRSARASLVRWIGLSRKRSRPSS